MTYTFYRPSEGRYIIYDSASGAVIRADELQAYICDALDPCGDEVFLPLSCPSEIRYELARFSSTEVGAAYEKIREYFSEGLIYTNSDRAFIRTSGCYSADGETINDIFKEARLSRDEVMFVD